MHPDRLTILEMMYNGGDRASYPQSCSVEVLSTYIHPTSTEYHCKYISRGYIHTADLPMAFISLEQNYLGFKWVCLFPEPGLFQMAL